jgi:spore maturation protein CgeB
MRAFGRVARPFAIRELNRAVLREARGTQPHLFVAIKGACLQAETLRTMRAFGVRLYCFYPDVSITAHGPYLPKALPEYDWIFITKSFGPSDLKARLGVQNSSYLPHAFPTELFTPRPVPSDLIERYECDVSFIGNWTPSKQALLEGLILQRPSLDLKIWGDWSRLPDASPLRPYVERRPVTGFEYALAVRSSRVNLGLLSELVPGASSGDRITQRTFHIPAAGGLMLHERTEDLLEIFTEDDSCACFEGVQELVEKVDSLLSDDGKRAAIARRGLEVVQGAHTWDHRASTILDHYVESVRD